ncbi:MAG: hypothetical protein GAK37_01099 [Pseudomonas sp.]|nr:MAG: hypothetical protein GAK37_01099 [Pseudomonas sp.]
MIEQPTPLIRRPLLTGHQHIDGLWLAAERFDERERARLLLAHWQRDARAYRFADGDLVCWREPLPLQCDTLSGWPLVRQGTALCSALLAPEERRHLPAADVWLVRGSQVTALHVSDAQPLHPGQWLDISAYTQLDTYDCRSILPELAPEPSAVASDVRTILGGPLKPVSPEQVEVMKALLERQRQGNTRPSAPRKAPGENPWAVPSKPLSFWWKTGLLLLVLVGIDVIAHWRQRHHLPPIQLLDSTGRPVDWVFWLLASLVGFVVFTLALMGLRKLLVRAPAVVPVTPVAAQPPLAPRATAARRQPAVWRRWLTRLAQKSQLSKLYGQRQAAYMQRMLEMFDNGDLEEALRHAIPLGGAQGPREQSFGTPQRRDNLTLSEQTGSARSLLLEDDLESRLRTLYRQSFERLDREGRVEEAVFVLAELLKAHQEALDYLEKHGRHQQASDLALAWDMPAATIVRLLCLAGNWQRAVLVARRDNAFAAAVTLLKAKWPDAADRLRVEWAESLLAQGLWLEAVDVIWSLPAERERAAQWLLNAEAAGGRLAIGALVKRAILLPQTLEAYGPWVEQLRDDPLRFNERGVLAETLLAHKAESSTLAWLAGATVQAIIVDQAAGQGCLTQNQLLALVKMSRDKLLMADLPIKALKRPPVMSLDQHTETLEWTAPEKGSRMIFDTVPLSDERYLVALGEAGATVIDAAGETLFHFAVPTTQLVLAHSAQVALALVRRGELWRISKLDLVRRTATDLGVLQMDRFAQTFDGTAWTIGRGRQLRVVDVHRGFETLWQVGDLPGVVCGVRSDEHNEYVSVYDERAGQQIWHYRLPERRLVSRDPVPDMAAGGYRFRLFTANSNIAQFELKFADNEPAILVFEQGGQRKGYRLPDLDEGIHDELVHPEVLRDWLLVRYSTAHTPSRWLFINRSSDRVCAALQWPRHEVSLRERGDDWLLFDDEGRLCHIDVAQGRQRNISLH